MLNAIGASTYPYLTGSASSTGGLEAQLSKYQSQLADWAYCASCNTPEGKAKITEISNKIGEIKQSIKSAANAKQRSLSVLSAAIAPSTINNRGILSKPPGLSDGPGNQSTTTSSLATGTLGNRLDIFA